MLPVHLGVMETVDDALASFIRSVFPSLISQQSLIPTFKGLGVETLEDLKYVQEAISMMFSDQLKQENRFPDSKVFKGICIGEVLKLFCQT